MGERSETVTTWGSVRAAAIGSLAAAVLGGGVLLVSMLAISPTIVSPHETTSGVTVEKVEYYLPYPGILPDSPLYKLKAVRDRVSLLTTFDPIKKAEKELFLADKRINAAQALYEGGKVDLAISVATKAEKYLASSTANTIKLSDEGKDVKSHLAKLSLASLKHIDLLTGFKEKSNPSQVIVIEKTIMEVDSLHKQIDQALIESE